MPDLHIGAGCTIGTTIIDNIVPNLVSVGTRCGMKTCILLFISVASTLILK